MRTGISARECTKSILRHSVLICILSFCVPAAGHATHESNLQPVLYGTADPIVTNGQQVRTPGYPTDRNPYSDELWLFGAFLVSLGGVVMLNLFLHRKSRQ